MASSYANTHLELGRTPPEEVFDIIKQLTQSDVDHGQCRLLLKKSFVENHILPYRIDADQCGSPDGLRIAVCDADETRESHLILKQWSSTKSYVLAGNWIPDFVTRKGLQEGDKVGLKYLGSTLYFNRLN